ncbi:MAG: hypothetical protein HQK54_17565 [Oligoflexales bacterium]|nr:hypothetical protein [Oligoflexales bacterium]
MTRLAEISFRVIGDSGPLSIYFYPGPYGYAVDAGNKIGVGWFSQTGELLGVEFDDVDKKQDYQFLDFDDYRVEVWIKKGKIKYQVVKKEKRKQAANE